MLWNLILLSGFRKPYSSSVGYIGSTSSWICFDLTQLTRNCLTETWNIYGIKIRFIMRGVRVFGQIFATGYITNILITVIKNNIENKFSLVCEVLWNVTSADSKKLLLIWESLLIHGDSKIIFFSTGCVCGVFNLENVFEFVRRRCEFRHDQVVTVGCSFFKITFDLAQRTIIFLVIFHQSLTLIFIKNCSSL